MPDAKCSNQDCQGGNGRPWAAWADAPKGGARPAQRVAAPAPAPPARAKISPEQFWTLMTDALIQAKASLTEAGLPLDQAREIAAQYFILVEHGLIAVPSTGPAKVAQQVMKGGAETDQGEAWYLERLELCTTVADVEEIQAELRRDVKDKVLLASLLAQALKAKRAMSMKENAA